MRGFGVLVLAVMVAGPAVGQEPNSSDGQVRPRVGGRRPVEPIPVATGRADFRETPTGWEVAKTADAAQPFEPNGRVSVWDEVNRQQRERAESKLTWGAVVIGLGLLFGFVRLLWAVANARPRPRRTSDSYPAWVADADNAR